MGTTTPEIGIYLPDPGETDYSESFNAGMINIDQHDHSGGPNMGVPIGTTALADNSVTYEKLAANVADNTTGIDTSAILPHQLILLDPLKSIYALGQSAAVGFLTLNGPTPSVRTLIGSSTISITPGDGSSNPVISVIPTGLPTLPVNQGGTGRVNFNIGALITGNLSSTVGGLNSLTYGTSGQVLTSQGVSLPPAWVNPQSVGTLQTVKVSLTGSQLRALNSSPTVLVPAQAGSIIIPIYCLLNFTYGGTPFTGLVTTNVTWNSNLAVTKPLDDIGNGFFGPLTKIRIINQTTNLGGINLDSSFLVNTPITLTAGSDMGGGTSSTLDVYLTYYVITL